ncbi:GNAT family N-acetyltransferase [Cribrihabitans pelagius]|uniref:GNAT family N-acetyltransferase n=1 Tax=Cribrihabitans pelagius TaxID=1765746 RepID=UPI003B58BAC6
MSLTLSLILPREAALLTAALAPYFAEVAPEAGIDPDGRARQMLHRKDVTAFWIRGDGARIGFAAVLNLPDDRRELSELCIFPRHRRLGWGQQAAQAILCEFPGRWRMGISSTSREAAAFWGTCLSLMPGIRELRTGAPFTEHQVKSYTFDIAGAHDD